MMRSVVFVLVCTLLVLSLSVMAYAKPDPAKHKYGGFDVTITHTDPGAGTFSIVGENEYGSVSVSGTFETITDPDTEEVTVRIVLDAGSTVISADGTVYDLSGKELVYTPDANAKKIICNVINYIKTLLEG